MILKEHPSSRHQEPSESNRLIQSTKDQIAQMLDGSPQYEAIESLFIQLKEALNTQSYHWEIDDYKNNLLMSDKDRDQALEILITNPVIKQLIEEILLHVEAPLRPIILERLKQDLLCNAVYEQDRSMDQEKSNWLIIDDDMVFRWEKIYQSPRFWSSNDERMIKTLKHCRYFEVNNLYIDDSNIDFITNTLEKIPQFSQFMMSKDWVHYSPQIRTKLAKSLQRVPGIVFPPSFVEIFDQDVLTSIIPYLGETRYCELGGDASNSQEREYLCKLSSSLTQLRMLTISINDLLYFSPQELKKIFHTSPTLRALIINDPKFMHLDEDQIKAIFDGLPIASLSMYWKNTDTKDSGIFDTFLSLLPPLEYLSIQGYWQAQSAPQKMVDSLIGLIESTSRIQFNQMSFHFGPDDFLRLGKALAQKREANLMNIDLGAMTDEAIFPFFEGISHAPNIRLCISFRPFLKRFQKANPNWGEKIKHNF